jgi:uroporphyrinogen decarboxylase
MAALDRGIPDRVPWGLWGHFPAVDWLERYSWEKATRDGEENARAHLALLRELDYKMDLLKVTPYYKYMAMKWGSEFQFVDNNENASTLNLAVKESDDWEKLWVLDPRKELRENLFTVEVLSRKLVRMPFIYTVPSPLIQALNHLSTPEQVYRDMKENPDALKKGLEIISETCIDFSNACIAAGATGIFYGIGGGGRVWADLNREQLDEWALAYDLKVLKAIQAPIKVLHICSTQEGNPQDNGGLMEDGWFKQYPVEAINWASHSFTPLSKGKEVYGDHFCIIGGLDHAITLRRGTPEQVEEETKEAINAGSRNGGFIIGPGCTLYQDMPIQNYNAVGKAIINYGKY